MSNLRHWIIICLLIQSVPNIISELLQERVLLHFYTGYWHWIEELVSKIKFGAWTKLAEWELDLTLTSISETFTCRIRLYSVPKTTRVNLAVAGSRSVRCIVTWHEASVGLLPCHCVHFIIDFKFLTQFFWWK
jgi:hypothetical protein